MAVAIHSRAMLTIIQLPQSRVGCAAHIFRFLLYIRQKATRARACATLAPRPVNQPTLSGRRSPRHAGAPGRGLLIIFECQPRAGIPLKFRVLFLYFFAGTLLPLVNERTRGRRGATMHDLRNAKILSHRRNIQRYCRLLGTELTELERSYLHKRIAEEQAELERWMMPTAQPRSEDDAPIAAQAGEPHPPPLTSGP
jgi:hypothetical protein